MRFVTGFIDPRPAEYRKKLNRLTIRDLADSCRWGLHLSEDEHAYLRRNNPDTLGHPDQAIAKACWKEFLNHPSSKPYRVQEVI